METYCIIVINRITIMKKTLLVAISFIVSSIAFSSKGGTSSTSAPAATISNESKSGVSDSFEDFGKLPSAPSIENRVSELSEKFSSKSELSKPEKKEIKKEIKAEIKSIKHELKNENSTNNETLLLAIIAIFIPPLAVFLLFDDITTEFWIDLLLTFLLFIPGMIYALYLILS